MAWIMVTLIVTHIPKHSTLHFWGDKRFIPPQEREKSFLCVSKKHQMKTAAEIRG